MGVGVGNNFGGGPTYPLPKMAQKSFQSCSLGSGTSGEDLLKAVMHTGP